VLRACEEYGERTGRRVTLEYVLLGGVNTSAEAAQGVARIARRVRALVNLISFNRVEGSEFHPPDRDELKRFRDILQKSGVPVTQRYRRGRDIAAGCGQLTGRTSSRRSAPGGQPDAETQQ